uniref:Glycosyltransferase n=1 Tax=Streptomyces lincolnensis TaxID=1915 RepID=UPI0030BA2B46
MTARTERGRALAFVWLMVEGAQVAAGGVAGYVRNLLDEQDALRDHLAERGWSVEFVLGEPFYDPGAPGYDEERWRRVREHLAARGGRAVRLVSDSDGLDGWGEERFFHALSATGAQLVLDTAERCDAVVAVSGTSAFARVPGMVQRQGGELAAKVLHVHTFGLATHDTAHVPSPAEIAADGDVAFWTRQSDRVSVGYISRYTAELYARTYAIPAAALLPNRSAIPRHAPRFGVLTEERINERIAGLGLPAEGEFVVMWGRNSAPGLDKGYHLLLEAARDLPGVVPVIATRRPDPGLRRLADRYAVPAVLLDDQPFTHLSALLQSPRTLAAAFLGEAEPGAVSPMEAMWVARESGALVIAADTGNLPEVVDDGAAGIVTRRTAADVADAVRRVRKLTADERRRMRAAAAARVRARFDFAANVRELADAAVDRLAEVSKLAAALEHHHHHHHH